MQTGIRVGDAMQRALITIPESATVSEAARKMKAHNVSSLLVNNKSKKIVGIITAKDLVYKAVAKNTLKARAGILASRPLKGIEAEADLVDAAKMMRNEGIKHLVVFAEGHIVGMLSEKDIVQLSPSLYDLIAEEQRAGFFPEFRAKVREAKNKLFWKP